jgi:hypothetical protein
MTIAIRSGKFKVRSGAVLAHATLTALIAPIAITTFTALFVWSASAHAGVSIAGTGAAGGMSATDATAIQANRAGGSGHISIIPYYSTQGGNSTLINITNTDLANGKAVKVRFRSAINADSVYDFTVLLGPTDVWAANVSQGANGLPTLSTSDGSCTLPANVNAEFSTARLPLSQITATPLAAWSREGYVDIITMADVPPGSALFNAINHVNGSASCGRNEAGAAALNALTIDPASETDARSQGFNTPTTGLLVSSILINVFDASVAWSTPTTSITAVTAAGIAGRGRLVFSPQTAAFPANRDWYTNDPLLRNESGGGLSALVPVQRDLPDLSTPYVGITENTEYLPFRHIETLSSALALRMLSNEFLTDPAISARTDWVVTQPTRRFAVGVDYQRPDTVDGFPSRAVNQGVAGPSLFFPRAARSERAACLDMVLQASFQFRGREGSRGYGRVSVQGNTHDGQPLREDRVAQPPDYRPPCAAVEVLVFDNALSNSALRAVLMPRVVTQTFDSFFSSLEPRPTAGSAVYFLDYQSPGPPVIGAAYIRARGPLVAGKSTNFGVLYNHGGFR